VGGTSFLWAPHCAEFFQAERAAAAAAAEAVTAS